VRDPSIGAPKERVAFELSYLPFPKTAADRKKSGDPRRSVAERYASREEYTLRYTEALDALIGQRWILAETAPLFSVAASRNGAKPQSSLPDLDPGPRICRRARAPLLRGPRSAAGF